MTSTYRAHLQAKVEETDVFQEITYQGPRWSKLPKPTDAQAAWNRAAAKWPTCGEEKVKIVNILSLKSSHCPTTSIFFSLESLEA